MDLKAKLNSKNVSTGVLAVCSAIILVEQVLKKRDCYLKYKRRKISISRYEKIKRALDVFFSLLLILILLPLFGIISVIIFVDDPGPVIFKQKRVGKDRELFLMHKFRTMKESAPHDSPTHMLQEPEKYITKAGGLLRKSSLDELPQLWDIFRGKMSFIGPRPALWNQDDLIAEREKYGANGILPGLSGLAQISGRDKLVIADKARLDGRYAQIIQKGGMGAVLIDCKCCLGTIGAVISHKGIAEGIGKLEYVKDEAKTELVSIIMPVYNTRNYVKASIESILAQTHENWELIIVDDCSTDGTEKVIKKFLGDARIRYEKNKNNLGAGLSRNKALRLATGKWIAFLDSDDIWEKEKLECQIRYMHENGYDFTYTDYRIQLNGKWKSFICTGPDKVTKRKLYNYNYFSTITVMYDRRKVGLIQVEDLKKANDYAMWFQALDRVDAYRLPKCLSYYIKHDNSVSSGSKFELIGRHYILFRKGLHMNIIPSLVLTINNIFHGLIKRYRYREKL